MVDKKRTARFYTEHGTYMGWVYINAKTYLEIRSWLLSGNTIKIEDKVFHDFSTFDESMRRIKC